jgi:hypothetical protein
MLMLMGPILSFSPFVSVDPLGAKSRQEAGPCEVRGVQARLPHPAEVYGTRALWRAGHRRCRIRADESTGCIRPTHTSSSPRCGVWAVTFIRLGSFLAARAEFGRPVLTQTRSQPRQLDLFVPRLAVTVRCDRGRVADSGSICRPSRTRSAILTIAAVLRPRVLTTPAACGPRARGRSAR